MVYTPKTQQELYEDIRDRLTGKIAKLTNFVTTSFNYVWTTAYTQLLRQNEVALLASQLSGFVEYAGGPVTQAQLDALGIDSVTPEEINQYMNDEDLDRLVEIVGISRDPGEEATGQVTITTVNPATTVPAGTEFGTQPDNDTGEFLSYFTTEQVSTSSGVTTVTADIEAAEVGDEYNVGAGQVTYMPNPPTGVQSVSNGAGIDGGVDEETNDELRARAKNAVLNNSGGGTVQGIEGFIENNVDGVIAANVDEFPTGGTKQSEPYADVIVDGGSDNDVEDAIDASHPSGVRHYLVRPTLYTVNVDASVTGGDIDTADVEAVLGNYVAGLDVGEDLYRDQIIQEIMNADSSIDNITQLEIEIGEEPHTFSAGTDVYTLDKTLETDDGSASYEMGITEVTGTLSGTSGHTFVEDTDYQEWNSSAGDTSSPQDSIDWSLAGDDPDDGTTFYVSYNVDEDISVDVREKTEAGTMTITEV